MTELHKGGATCDSIVETLVARCQENQERRHQLYVFLEKKLGKEVMREISFLSPEDSTSALIEHVRIGLTVGSIQCDELHQFIL